MHVCTCVHIYIDRPILHPSLLTVRHRAAGNYTVIAISFNYFLPDPCNSFDTEPVTQNERGREKTRERKRERERGERKSGIIGATRVIGELQIKESRSANNTGALSQSRKDPRAAAAVRFLALYSTSSALRSSSPLAPPFIVFLFSFLFSFFFSPLSARVGGRENARASRLSHRRPSVKSKRKWCPVDSSREIGTKNPRRSRLTRASVGRARSASCGASTCHSTG